MPEFKPSVQERSIGELFGKLTEDMTLLMRQEVALAKAEMSQKVSRATSDMVAVGAGALVALVGGLAIVAAVILVLVAIGITPWLSALIVGVVMGLAGYVMLQRGLKQLRQVDPAPRRTMETLKDDVQWAKEQRP
ncbi:MAG TPA: phage holin family protein [Gemmatimonadales bacterium]|nr:phage holin family protein [Gemmatimonadales bacterium]